jgi:hypothetical protein
MNKNITVILNMYRRPQNMNMQIASVRQQTIKPNEVWIWKNHHDDNKSVDLNTFDVDRRFNNDFNWKFYGRFAGAMLAQTEYVAIFDDDTIPGNKWFENCLDTISKVNGILGTAGVILNSNMYVDHERCGWPSQNEQITRVDLVGHAWFFRKDWLKYLWMEKPATWENGEDIHFSYLAQKYGNIETYCPPHPKSDKMFHGSLLGMKLGTDSVATSNNITMSHKQFFSERDLCVQNAINGGWKTVRNIK